MERLSLEVHDGSKPLQEGYLRVVCMSDNHTYLKKVPPGDIFIHAGDFSDIGRPEEILEFNEYLESLKFDHKIVIAGNHDTPFDLENFQKNVSEFEELQGLDPREVKSLLTNCTYLEDSGVVVEGYKIWGSPWAPARFKGAFLRPRKSLQNKWKTVPEDTDILVTHSPPHNIRDKVKHWHLGCKFLAQRITEVRPLVHVFGHIHEGHGHSFIDGINYLNAAICSPLNEPVHNVSAFDLPRRI